jgi:hypothetical protein
MISEASMWAPVKGEKDRTEEGVRDYFTSPESTKFVDGDCGLRRAISAAWRRYFTGKSRGKEEG